MVYGDTDSSFFTNDDKEYELMDLLYNNNEITKQQYWTEMVNKSIQVTENIKNEINEYLVQYSGSNYLKMGFDGVLFPSQFLDKKKYKAWKTGIENIQAFAKHYGFQVLDHQTIAKLAIEYEVDNDPQESVE